MRAILTFLIALVFSSNLFANSLNEILKEIFPKSSNIFGVEIIATEKVKDKKFIIIYNNSEYNLPTKLPKF